MKKFDRQSLTTLRAELEASLFQLSEKHGITFTIGKMIYSETGDNVRVPLEFATVGESGLANNREAEDFKRYAAMLYELDPADFGREFTVRGETYQVVGLNTRKSKFAIKCKKLSDQRVYGLHAEDVKRAFAAQPRVAKSA